MLALLGSGELRSNADASSTRIVSTISVLWAKQSLTVGNYVYLLVLVGLTVRNPSSFLISFAPAHPDPLLTIHCVTIKDTADAVF